MSKRPSQATTPLDDIDKRLIQVLQIDGRKSFADLAPHVGLSQAAVRQRVNRLIELDVIQIVGVTDPLAMGFKVVAMIGITAEGDLEEIAERLGEIDRSDYVVITAGRYDLLLELTCEDNDHLLSILNDEIRTIPGVTHAEAFTYLKLHKQTYAWGTR